MSTSVAELDIQPVRRNALAEGFSRMTQALSLIHI